MQLEVMVIPSHGSPKLRAEMLCAPKAELGRQGSCEEGSPTEKRDAWEEVTPPSVEVGKWVQIMLGY